MPRVYSGVTEAISPTILPVEMLVEIGRLVRAFADTEDLVTLYICKLATVTESAALVMLGRSGLKARIDMAEYLAAMKGEDAANIHKAVFNAGFQDALECRNAVAHGRLLGVTKDMRYAFLTSKTEKPDSESAVQLAITYSLESIAGYAKAAVDAVHLIARHLRLPMRQEEYPPQDLQPHRKGRIPRNPNSKPKARPGSSQA